LLGVALGLLYSININFSIIIICSIFAIILAFLQQKKILTTDTLLGILAHAALSIGMVTISFLDNNSFDLHSYLFGNILTVTKENIYWIYGCGSIIIFLLIKNWSTLTLITIHEDLAKAEGIKTFRMNLLLMFLMTLIVSISIQIVGILLITSMLIIPAATARKLVSSPENMAIMASIIGSISVILGIISAVQFDIILGPTIVTTEVIFFIILLPFSLFIRKH
jgi:zinc transport system permease protein